MFWFVNIAILLLGYAANKAIASWLRQRAKPALPGPFELPVVPAGQGWIVTYGTTRGAMMCTWFQGAKLVEQNLSSIDNITHIGSRRTVAYMYKVTAQLVLGVGPIDGIRNLIFNNNKALTDEPVNQTYDYGDGVITSTPAQAGVSDDGVLKISKIFLPNVFGGKGRGGGFTAVGGDHNDPFGGFLRLHRGGRIGDDEPDAVMEQYLGVGNVPVYGDLAYLVLDDVNVGESTVMPSVEPIFYKGFRPENTPGGGIGGFSGPTIDRTIAGRVTNWQMTDVSPVMIAFDIMVNPLIGVNIPRFMIKQGGLGTGYDNGTFEAAHRRLQAEGIGMSMRFEGTRAAALDALEEIERTVDAHIEHDPNTFQWMFRLNRNEASTPEEFAALPLFDAENVLGVTLSKPLWKETYNEVTVEFTDAAQLLKRSTETVQNAANIAMTGGIRPLPNVQYLAITDRSIARKLAARDLKKVSIPFYKGQIKVTRAGWSLVKGQVFRLTYDHKYSDVSQMLFRVLSIDYGEETANEITVDVVQDVFSFDDIQRAYAPPSTPPRMAAIIAPRVSRQVGDKISDILGQLTITLEDPERRTYEIAFRTQVANAAASAWNVVASATPNVADPAFPFANPATDTDLNGDHLKTVALSQDGESIIEYRIRFLRYGPASDPTNGYGEFTGTFPFTTQPRPPSAPGVASDATVRWKLNGTGAGGVILPGSFCPFGPTVKAGLIVGWRATCAPTATLVFDIWKKAGSAPSIANALGLSSAMRIVSGTAASGTFATPIAFAIGDYMTLQVVSNDVATTGQIDLLLAYTG